MVPPRIRGKTKKSVFAKATRRQRKDDVMTRIMNATVMTDGQIENAVNKFRDAMRKHRSEISSNVAQRVLGVKNIGMIMFDFFREYVNEFSNLIIRKVKVNRSRSPQGALDATGRVQHTDRNVVDEMPKGEGNEVEIVFFKLDLDTLKSNGIISDDDLEKEFEARGLKSADPVSVAAVNENEPTFAGEYPHGTHWKNAEGDWCYIRFCNFRDNKERNVYVKQHNDRGWDAGWMWFAGIRKAN